MPLPRSCACGAIHQPGQRCPTAVARWEKRRGKTTERFGSGWESISKQVIKRDRGICHLCGQPRADTADHIVPRSKGGDNHPSNLRAAHRSCNSARGNRR